MFQKHAKVRVHIVVLEEFGVSKECGKLTPDDPYEGNRIPLFDPETGRQTLFMIYCTRGSDLRKIVSLQETLPRPRMLSPHLTESIRPSRKSRSLTRSTKQQFPGYIFVRHDSLDTMQHPRWRDSFRPLRVPGTATHATLPASALAHALWLEERSASSPLPAGRTTAWTIGDRVALTRGPLVAARPGAVVVGVIEEIRGSRLVVQLDGMVFPVTCSVDDVVAASG